MTQRSGAASARGQRGFLLLGVLTAVLVLGILSGVAVQDWTVIEQREKEAQLLFLQEQYASAILAYQKSQGALPTDLEQLTKKGQAGAVFLRHPWVDPMTRGAKLSDWCLWKMGGVGQVVSSCATGEGTGDSSADGTADGDTGWHSTSKTTPRTGSQSLSGFGQPETSLRTGTATQRLPQGQGGVPGAGPGAILGVHSKSGAKAYNTAKRGGETYREWQYTVQEFLQEMAARSIPGMPAKPPVPGQHPGTRPGAPRPGALQPGSPMKGGPFDNP